MQGKYFVYKRIRLIVALMMTTCVACVFFGMALGINGWYLSDSPDHIEAAIKLEGYGLETVFFYFIAKFTSYPFLQFLFAIWETSLVILTWLFCQKFVDDYFHIDQWLNLLISTGLIFLCSIYIPVICPTFYNNSLGTQSWHSSTQLAMRLGATVFLYSFLDVYPEYIKGISKQKWLRMAILLAVTTMFKPNFFMSFGATFGIVLLRDLLRNKTKKAFKQFFQFASIVIPSMAVLGIQYALIYGSDQSGLSSGIQLVFFSDLLWEGSMLHMLFKFGRDLAFPILGWIAVLCEKNVKQETVFAGNDLKNIKFLILLYLVSLTIFSLFKETGLRASHGNFEWGVQVSYFSLFLYLAPVYIRSVQTIGKKILTNWHHMGMMKGICTVGSMLLILHFVSGLLYFTWIASGRSFLR